MAEREDTAKEVFEDLPARAIREIVGDGLRGGLHLLRSYAKECLKACVPGVLILLLGGAIGAGFMHSTVKSQGLSSVFSLYELPWGVRTGILILLLATVLAVLLTLGLLVRVAGVVRRQGRLPRSWSQRHELDEVVGNYGFWQTGIALLFLFPAGCILAAGGWFAGLEAVRPAGMPAIVTAALCALVAAAVLCQILLIPFMWALPLMAEHDCGWIRGLEASTRLMMLAPERTLKIGWMCCLAGVTVIGLPLAAALLETGSASFGVLVPYLLKERTERQTRAEVRQKEEHAPRPKGVERGHRLLEQGRYLDAVNAFQMVQLKQFGQLDALRGECLAQLHLGNLLAARERLERWQLLDKENPEPAGLLGELQSGRWQEGGDRWEAARQRCTQEIGSGLTNEEVITRKAMQDLRRGVGR